MNECFDKYICHAYENFNDDDSDGTLNSGDEIDHELGFQPCQFEPEYSSGEGIQSQLAKVKMMKTGWKTVLGKHMICLVIKPSSLPCLHL